VDTLELIREDIEIARRHAVGRLGPMLVPNLVGVIGYRLAHLAFTRGHGAVARLVSVVTQLMTGAEINAGASIGPGMLLVHTPGIVVGRRVVAGRGLTLYGSTVLRSSRRQGCDGWPVLGDDVTLYAKASVLSVPYGSDAEGWWLLTLYACGMWALAKQQSGSSECEVRGDVLLVGPALPPVLLPVKRAAPDDMLVTDPGAKS
jgi:hypothetical protein